MTVERHAIEKGGGAQGEEGVLKAQETRPLKNQTKMCLRNVKAEQGVLKWSNFLNSQKRTLKVPF